MPRPHKEGYNFLFWTTIDGDARYVMDVLDITRSGNDITLYVYYEPASVTTQITEKYVNEDTYQFMIINEDGTLNYCDGEEIVTTTFSYNYKNSMIHFVANKNSYSFIYDEVFRDSIRNAGQTLFSNKTNIREVDTNIVITDDMLLFRIEGFTKISHVN